MDKISAVRRSDNMRAIRSKGMKPELAVRSLVHAMGIRYRLHKVGLPGKPDLVFASRRKVIFVHGCFWHSHTACGDGHFPRSRTEYWEPKLRRNAARDCANIAELERMGWRVLVIWECECKYMDMVRQRLAMFLAAN